MTSTSSSGIAPDLFRAVAGSLPTGVTVVTTLDGGGNPVGMTSGAVCGLSCTPPLLLTCVDRESRTLAAIRERGAFCVNVLDGDAAWLSDRFAGPVAERFVGVGWTPAANGTPMLSNGTVAHASCELLRIVDGGDHVIVLGLIVDGTHREDVRPLVYHRRRYAAFPSG